MISYYGEYMSSFNDHISNLNNKYRIVACFIDITYRCSKYFDAKNILENMKITTSENLSYSNSNFISWLALQLDMLLLLVLSENENYFVLFLNSRYTDNKNLRNLLDVLHSSNENSFSCIASPQVENFSYYDSEILISFK